MTADSRTEVDVGIWEAIVAGFQKLSGMQILVDEEINWLRSKPTLRVFTSTSNEAAAHNAIAPPNIMTSLWAQPYPGTRCSCL